MQEIRSTGALSAETEEKLKGALEQYTENFVNTRPEEINCDKVTFLMAANMKAGKAAGSKVCRALCRLPRQWNL